MIQVGAYNTLKINRRVDFGFYLDDGAEGILLPKRFAPPKARIGDEVKVFLYHDSDNRLIATTQEPKGIVGDIVLLEAVAVTPQGAFLDWGLMKDLFVAKSQQHTVMRKGGKYLVRIYLDQQTGRAAATEKIDQYLDNDNLTVKELEPVKLIVYRRSDIGYVVIINDYHTGMLHFNQVYREIAVGDRLEGYVSSIKPDGKIDVVLGKPGYQRVEDETEKLLRLLRQNKGFLPYHDKSLPEDIYAYFGMSKKTFKMTTGALYRQKKITIDPDGIRSVEAGQP